MRSRTGSRTGSTGPRRRSTVKGRNTKYGKTVAGKHVSSSKRTAGRAGAGAKGRKGYSRAERARRHQQKMKRVKVALVAMIALVSIALIALIIRSNRKVLSTLTVEAGTEVTASSFVLRGGDASYAPDCADFDNREIGKYTVKLMVDGKKYTSTLIIKDTKEPVVTLRDVEILYGSSISARDFVEAEDNGSRIEYEFCAPADVRKTGEQLVNILCTDRGGNQAVFSAHLTVRPVRKLYSVEAGSEIPDASVFSLSGISVAYADTSAVNMNVPGDYNLTLNTDAGNYDAILRVADTTPPVVEFKESVAYGFGSTPDPKDFVDVESISDYSEVTITGGCSALAEDTSNLSVTEYTYTVKVTDACGNTTVGEVPLSFKQDTTAPEILECADIYVYIGDTVSYKKNLIVQDDLDKDPTIDVDNAAVDTSKVGTYTVKYTVTDKAGNSTTASCTLHVAEKTVSEDEVIALADGVIASICTDDMTDKEKLQKIYTWVRSNVVYSDHSEKDDQVLAAYEGFTKHSGDCFVFAMTSKYLLNSAGIKNMDIKKIYIEGASSHYWNLVDYGEGWYHFDTTPRIDGSTFFLISDADLRAYSEKHKNSHKYDASIYPTIN